MLFRKEVCDQQEFKEDVAKFLKHAQARLIDKFGSCTYFEIADRVNSIKEKGIVVTETNIKNIVSTKKKYAFNHLRLITIQKALCADRTYVKGGLKFDPIEENCTAWDELISKWIENQEIGSFTLAVTDRVYDKPVQNHLPIHSEKQHPDIFIDLFEFIQNDFKQSQALTVNSIVQRIAFFGTKRGYSKNYIEQLMDNFFNTSDVVEKERIIWKLHTYCVCTKEDRDKLELLDIVNLVRSGSSYEMLNAYFKLINFMPFYLNDWETYEKDINNVILPLLTMHIEDGGSKADVSTLFLTYITQSLNIYNSNIVIHPHFMDILVNAIKKVQSLSDYSLKHLSLVLGKLYCRLPKVDYVYEYARVADGDLKRSELLAPEYELNTDELEFIKHFLDLFNNEKNEQVKLGIATFIRRCGFKHPNFFEIFKGYGFDDNLSSSFLYKNELAAYFVNDYPKEAKTYLYENIYKEKATNNHIFFLCLIATSDLRSLIDLFNLEMNNNHQENMHAIVQNIVTGSSFGFINLIFKSKWWKTKRDRVFMYKLLNKHRSVIANDIFKILGYIYLLFLVWFLIFLAIRNVSS